MNSGTYLADRTEYKKICVSISGTEEDITMQQRLKREEVTISNYMPTG